MRYFYLFGGVADSNDKILLSGSNLISFCYLGFHIGIYKSCLMFYNGVESNGFIGFGAVVARRRDMCRLNPPILVGELFAIKQGFPEGDRAFVC